MSCICGIVKNNEIWIAGDSAGTDRYSIALSGSPKVFKKQIRVGTQHENYLQEIIFGVVGSWSALQAVRHTLKLPIQNREDEEYLVVDVVSAVKACLEKEQEIAILLGYHRKLYRMNSDFGLFQIIAGYDAIGSGDDVAKGALYALSQNKYISAKDSLRIALSSAVELTPFVRQPFVYEHCSYFEPQEKQALVELSQKIS